MPRLHETRVHNIFGISHVFRAAGLDATQLQGFRAHMFHCSKKGLSSRFTGTAHVNLADLASSNEICFAFV